VVMTTALLRWHAAGLVELVVVVVVSSLVRRWLVVGAGLDWVVVVCVVVVVVVCWVGFLSRASRRPRNKLVMDFVLAGAAVLRFIGWCGWIRGLDFWKRRVFGWDFVFTPCAPNPSKYPCPKTSLAVILLSGSYVNVLLIRLTHSSPTCGIKCRIPTPFRTANPKFVSCGAFNLNFSRTEGVGVPNTLWIRLSWSISFDPEKRG